MNSVLKTVRILAAGGIAALLLAQPVFSADGHAGGMHHMHDMGSMMQAGGAGAAQGPISVGIVKKVDKDKQRVTLEHGPLTNLDMPGMTMSFQVKDAAMLDRMKEGDRIRFTAEKLDGRFTVTEFEPAGGADARGN